MDIVKYRVNLVKEDSFNFRFMGGNYYTTEVANCVGNAYDMRKSTEEVCVLVCLDVKSTVIGVFEVSRGSLSSCIIHPREVLKRALLCNAHSIIVIHNHPSGDVSPSREDFEITKKLRDACNFMGIKLVDHMILGDPTPCNSSGIYSFRRDSSINLKGK